MDTFQIFVSSTSVDLFNFREVVIDQLLRMGQVPIAMEHFGSRTADATEVCRQEVQQCDLFIGIYAFRYGYTLEENSSSITEDEYLLARRQGKRCLCYFAADSLRPAQASEPAWKQERLESFKQRIDRELVRATFSSPENLGRLIGADVDRLLRGDPLGYVLADVRERWRRWGSEYLTTRLATQENCLLDTVPSPLANAWNWFIRLPDWHGVLEDHLDKLAELAKGFAELTDLAQQTRDVNRQAGYAMILRQLRSLVKPKVIQQVDGLGKDKSKVRNMASILEELQDQVEEPTFHRCFLAVGGLGSGKSHFLASLLASIDAEWNDEFSLLLPLEPPFGQETLSDIVDHGIRKASQMSWRGIAEFDRFLGVDNSGDELAQLLPRLIIVIDDFQRWLYVRPNFQEELTRYIEDHSQHRRVYWFVLLQSTDYDKVCGNEIGAFWHHYGCIDRRSWVNVMSRRKIRSSYFLPELNESLPFKGGWLDLDRFNEHKQIGYRILLAKLEEDGCSVALAVKNVDKELTPTSLWANPFIAWALLELRAILPLETLVNLSFVEFVTRFWEKRRAVLQANLSGILNDPLLRAEVLLNQAVDLIVRCLLESHDLAPRLTYLLNTIVAMARDESELQQRPVAEKTLHVLEQGGLLERSVEKQSGGGLSEVEHVRMGIEPFWNLHLADQLHMRTPLVNLLCVESQLELDTWFGAVTTESIREGVLEFLLLRIDQEAATLGDFNGYMWRLALEDLTLPKAAAWFAGAKASAQTRRLLVDWAVDHPDQIGNRRSLFAFMYFVGEACTDIETARALSLLEPHYRAIHDAGFADYFLFIANRIFEHEDENAAIRASLPHLSGCEVMEVTDEVAAITMAALARNADVAKKPESGLSSLLALMVDYLQENQAQARSEYGALMKRTSWQRIFFREWLVFEFCHLCTSCKGLGAFDLLYNQNWYYPKEIGIEYPVSLEMEREANIALGREFRWEPHNFHELVIDLAASSNWHDRELAFHLIRHTETTEGKIAVEVDDCFRPLLEQMFLDASLERTVHRFFGFFEANLGNVAGLLTRRYQHDAERECIELEPSAALRVLALSAGLGSDNLPDAASEVLEVCGRIPLALALIEGAVHDGMVWSDLLDAWRRVRLGSAKWAVSKPSYTFIWKAMKVNINALQARDPDAVHRYVELCVFPPDTAISESIVVLLWQRSGEMDEPAAKRLLTMLEHRALVRIDGTTPNRYMTIPGPQHEYLHILHRDFVQLHKALLDAYQRQCTDGWASGPDDGYFFQWLPYHLLKVGRHYETRMLLFNYDWLSAKLNAAGVQSLVHDCMLLRQENGIQGLEKALQHAAPVLREDATQLAGQLAGRLLGDPSSEAQMLLALADNVQDKPWLRPLAASLREPDTLIRTLSGHPASVTTIAMMPTGKSIIAGSDDGLLIMWDWRSGSEQFRMVGHAAAVSTLAVTADGGQLISGANDGTLKVWDLEKGYLLRILRASEDTEEDVATALALLPDSQYLAVSFGDESIRVWDLVDYSEVFSLNGHTSPVTILAVTPNGKYIVSGSTDGTIGIWDVALRTQVVIFKSCAASVSALAVDNQCLVAGGADGTITSWDLSSQVETLTIQGHVDGVSALALSADGQKIVSASYDTTLAVWDLKRGARLRTLAGHTSPVTAVLLAADGRHTISASWDSTLRVWDLEDDGAMPAGHAWPIDALALSSHGQQAFSHAVDGTCRIWDVGSNVELSTTPGGVQNSIIATFLTDSNRLVMAISGGGLAVYDTVDGSQIMILTDNGQPVTALATTKDGRFVAAGRQDGTVEARNVSTGELIMAKSEREGVITAMALSDEHVVAGFDDGLLVTWELKTGFKVSARGITSQQITALALTSDSRQIVSGLDDGQIEVWDLTSDKPLHRFDGHQDWVKAIVVTGDGTHAVSVGRDAATRIWDLVTGDAVASFYADGALFACALAPDDHTIVIAGASGRVHFLRLEE